MKQEVTPIHVGKDVHQKVKIAAATAGVSIREWAEWAFSQATNKSLTMKKGRK